MRAFTKKVFFVFVILCFSTSAFAVEPTTFPNVPPEKLRTEKLQSKPSSAKKPVRKGTGEADVLVEPEMAGGKTTPAKNKMKKPRVLTQPVTKDGKPARKSTGEAGTLVQPNTVPRPAPTNIKTKKKPVFGQESENDDKPVRKGTSEAGVLVEPTIMR